MFNFNEIKNLKIAELRQFCAEHGITVEGIKTRRDSFLIAIAAFLDSQEMSEIKAAASEAAQEAIAQASTKVREVVTVENAMKTTMLTIRVLRSVTLVAIALVILAVGLWRDRHAVVVRVREKSGKVKRAIADKYHDLHGEGYIAFRYYAADPVLDWRDRIAQITGATITE